MVMRAHSLAVVIAIAAAVLAPRGGLAAASPRAYVEGLAKAAQRVMTRGTAETDVEEVAQFDIPTFARRCMIDHWDNLTQDQRAEFIAVFGASLSGRIERMIAKAAKRGAFSYVIGTPTSGSDGVIAVPLKVRVDDVTMTFVYSLVRAGESFRLVDYAVDGVLLSRNYRGQFNHLMRKHGFEGIIERMRGKIAALPETHGGV